MGTAVCLHPRLLGCSGERLSQQPESNCVAQATSVCYDAANALSFLYLMHQNRSRRSWVIILHSAQQTVPTGVQALLAPFSSIYRTLLASHCHMLSLEGTLPQHTHFSTPTPARPVPLACSLQQTDAAKQQDCDAAYTASTPPAHCILLQLLMLVVPSQCLVCTDLGRLEAG